jgi:hypothetical protein
MQARLFQDILYSPALQMYLAWRRWDNVSEWRGQDGWIWEVDCFELFRKNLRRRLLPGDLPVTLPFHLIYCDRLNSIQFGEHPAMQSVESARASFSLGRSS